MTESVTPGRLPHDRRADDRPRHTAPKGASGLGLLAQPVIVYVASRIVVYLVVGAVIVLGAPLPAHHYSGPWPDPPAGPVFVQALGSWDASWYLSIAQHGYFFTATQPLEPHQAQIAFFPVWPAIIRIVTDVTGARALNVAVVLSVLFGLLAAVAVWLVSKELCGRLVADRAVALWAFFPGSLVLTMAYAEGLTILASAVCLFGLLRRRWVLAGIAAGVGTGVQPEALILVMCCAWAAASAIRSERQWAALAAPLLSLAGVGAYFGYLYAKTGDVLRWYHLEHSVWKSGYGFAHTTVGVIHQTFTDRHVIDSVVLSIGLLVAVLGILAMISWRPPPVIWIYTIGILVLALGSNPVGARGRVLLVAFPLLIGVSRWVGERWSGVVMATSGVLLGALTMLVLSEVLIAP